MKKPKLLDLFCGAGGCSIGYARAGFAVTGIDIEEHRDYPFGMYRGDALEVLGALERDGLLGGYDVIHASPPCPRYSTATSNANRDKHPDLIGPVRERLQSLGVPYVIENVPGAPLDIPLLLCGSAFGLGVRRHRLFEVSEPVMSPGCHHGLQHEVWGVYGDHGDLNPVTRPDGSSRGNKARDAAHAGEVMGIDWMTRWDDLADAIPPAYTEHIGRQLIAHLGRAAA